MKIKTFPLISAMATCLMGCISAEVRPTKEIDRTTIDSAGKNRPNKLNEGFSETPTGTDTH